MRPENTLASFLYAIHAGVDRLEIDLNLTGDDVLIVVHDDTTHPDLVRDGDGRWLARRIPWRELSLAEVRRFDVGRMRPGSDYARRFPRQQAVDGERIPTFDEVAALVDAHPAVSINIEIKCDPLQRDLDAGRFAHHVVEAVHRHRLVEQVTVQSFHWPVVAAVRQLDDNLTTGALSARQADFDTIGDGATPSPWTGRYALCDFRGSMPAMVHAMGVDYWASDFRDLTTADIDEAHEQGLAVHAWTVNRPEDMKRLISSGIDSIITDYPDELLALVRRGG